MSARAHYIYRVYDDQGVPLYVGCTKSPLTRYRDHMAGRGDARGWFNPYADRWVFSGPYDKTQAREIEKQTIRDLTPVYNAQGLTGRTGHYGQRPVIDAYVARRRSEVAA